MPDLNAYISQVVDDDDKILLEEASRCLSVGSYRAAYITVWLACAEALRRKFRAAAPRDSEAARTVSAVTSREAEHRAVDAYLVRAAKKYGMISDAEATRLLHIYEKRNIFGHPYELSPDALMVESATSEVVEIVLGRPLALREGYLANQADRILTDNTFLADDPDSVRQYARLV